MRAGREMGGFWNSFFFFFFFFFFLPLRLLGNPQVQPQSEVTRPRGIGLSLTTKKSEEVVAIRPCHGVPQGAHESILCLQDYPFSQQTKYVSWLASRLEAAPFQGPMTPTQDAAGPDPDPAPTGRPGGRAASRGGSILGWVTPPAYTSQSSTLITQTTSGLLALPLD